MVWKYKLSSRVQYMALLDMIYLQQSLDGGLWERVFLLNGALLCLRWGLLEAADGVFFQ